MKIRKLIETLGGELVQGDAKLEIDGVSSGEFAGPSEVAFADNAASASIALGGPAGAVIVQPGLVSQYPADKTVVESQHPRLWFARAAKLLKRPSHAAGFHPTAIVAPHAEVDPSASVGPGAMIGANAQIGAHTRIEAGAVIGHGVRIGEFCHVYPRAVLYPDVIVGNHVVIHAGAVLGADGFGYVRDPETGAYTQFPQQGTLVIEDEVEIGANCTIDRGALGETRVRRGAKFDNLVHVAHNCDIGEDVVIAALTGISGSSTVGKGAILAGQVGIGDHAHVGPGVILGGQAGVFSGKTVTNEGLKPGTVHWGTPARPLQQVLREQATVARLARRKTASSS
jgi:UDP-3-O-[3-hydroxymyristoyl] glucosamine N-acyltransferase